MDEQQWLTAAFEEHRPHLRAVAYRMLGSSSDAEDAVQEAWIRLDRTDVTGVDNLRGWLTTVVARVSLNHLRARQRRREGPLDVHLPELVLGPAVGRDPEEEAVVADSVGLALLVVLDSLTPAERLAFVLHDVFAVPFEEIAPLLERTPAAARQLASRARRRVREAGPAPDVGLAAQREVVDAFFAAGRNGSFDQLIAVLHPDVTLRVDVGAAAATVDNITTGATAVARRARMFADARLRVHPVTVNGAAGVVVLDAGRPVSVMGFTVVAGRIVTIDVLRDPERLDRLDLAGLHLAD